MIQKNKNINKKLVDMAADRLAEIIYNQIMYEQREEMEKKSINKPKNDKGSNI